MKKILRLGSRGSPLALLQAEEVRNKILQAHPTWAVDGEIEIVPIRTTGDWRPEHKERSLMDMGGDKGLFTKEIDEALQANFIDMAVHSMKDVPTLLPDDLEFVAVLDRLDPRDAFLGRHVRTLDELPSGAVVGTSSLRRQAQILARRPDLVVKPLRGNIDTRIRKLNSGDADATLLAVAGMMRLGVTDRISSTLDTDVMLPSAAQGALGVEIRRDNEAIRSMLSAINMPQVATCIQAERALLRVLDGSCHTPIGALAEIQTDGTLKIDGLVAKPDGTAVIRLEHAGSIKDAENVGKELGAKLKKKMPANFFAA